MRKGFEKNVGHLQYLQLFPWRDCSSETWLGNDWEYHRVSAKIPTSLTFAHTRCHSAGFGGHCDNWNYTGMLVAVSKTPGVGVTNIQATEAAPGESNPNPGSKPLDAYHFRCPSIGARCYPADWRQGWYLAKWNGKPQL
jgi:hypothetical protein